MIKFEYPLQWLPQQSKTKTPTCAVFSNHSIYKASNYLVNELELMKVKNCIISSNLRIKNDGTPWTQQHLDDNGIVVYFDLKGQGKAMACDKYNRIEHNLWALYKSVQAIRGLERWGGSEFLEGLFTGFKALPAPEDVIISETNYFLGIEKLEDLKQKYKELAKELHPDMGGDINEFNIMNKQYTQRKDGY